ncbi:Transcription factor [Penicillium freii]|nr:Transcription factor [Penicillium freii]
MRSQMRLLATVCSRLQHTASVFLQLAQAHVSGRVLTQTIEKPTKSLQPPPIQPTYSYDQHPEDMMDLDFGELNVSNYLEWLPADMGSAWPMFDTNRPDVVSRPANKRPSQGSGFDWFSWDTYYSGTET